MVFDRILKLGNPAALRKYAGTYKDKSIADVASIAEGWNLIDSLIANATHYRDYGLSMPPARLIALNESAGQSLYVEVDLMVSEGFSTELPIHLFMAVEQGDPRDTSNDTGGPEKFPLKTQNGILMEVHDCCYRIAAYGDTGYQMIFDEIDMAAQAHTPPPPPPDPHCDPAAAEPEQKSKGKK